MWIDVDNNMKDFSSSVDASIDRSNPSYLPFHVMTMIVRNMGGRYCVDG